MFILKRLTNCSRYMQLHLLYIRVNFHIQKKKLVAFVH